MTNLSLYSLKLTSIIWLFLAVVSFAGSASGATFTVTNTNDSGAGSLRQAILDANAATSDDIIEFDQNVFAAVRAIVLTSSGLILENNGSIVINGGNANLLTVSGSNRSSVFNVRSSTNATINGMTIANGGSSAPGGGGDGGGIFNFGVLTVNNSIIKNNFATFNGGGIYNNGSLTVNNSTISNNSSSEGAGIYHQVGVVNINNSTVSGNTGGGISNRSLVNVTDSTINENSGGGVYNFGGTVNFTNSTVSGNTRNGVGGGITNESGIVNLLNSTVAFNSASAGNGGGIYRGGGTINARNSIIAQNLGNFSPSDIGGILNSQGYNLIGTTTFATITGDTTGNLLNVSAQLLPLASNGGATQTHALQPGSPAIDAGDPANVLLSDQRGISRPVDGNADGAARADIGAIEAGILVTNNNDAGSGSLRQAIADANATAANDEIRFSNLFDSPQTITLTSGELTAVNNGSLIINGTGANLLTVSGNNQSRAFHISGGANVAINGITLTGNNSLGINHGGAVINDPNGTLTISNAIIDNNRGYHGAGIYNQGLLTVIDSIVRGNIGNGDGGGICNSSRGALTVRNSTISDNRAGFGGGISNGGSALVINSTLSGNSTTEGGGGGATNGGSSATLNFINSIVNNNASNTSGGGFQNYLGTLNVINSTISSNSANNGNGGGIYNESGWVSFSDATVGFNQARRGGGVFNYEFNNSVANARNTIVSNNSATINAPDFAGTLSSQGYNLIGNVIGAIIAGDTTGNLLNVSAQLLPLASNGGATQTHALQPGSPAIDAGDPANMSGADQRGFNRTTDGNGDGMLRTDMGAYESGNMVTNTNSNGAGSFAQAILDARNAPGDDEIRFSSTFNTSQTITLTGTELFIGGGNLVINGPGSSLLTISGNNQSRVFNVSVFANLTLNGLTVTGGRAVNGDGGGIINHGNLTLNSSVVTGNTANGGGNNPAAGGGGIFNNNGRLILNSSLITNNNTTSFNGGGIFNNTGMTIVNDSTIADNTASSEGGGIFNYFGEVRVTGSSLSTNAASRSGGIRNQAIFTMTNSTIRGNVAQQLYGGIYNSGTFTITGSTISDNRSPTDGGGAFNLGTMMISSSTVAGNSSNMGAGINNNGGINNDRGKLTIMNSTLSRNNATVSGGGIYTVGGTVNLTNLTIAFNSANSNAGGIFNSGTVVTARNSIIARNSTGMSASDYSGALISQGYNLIGNNSGISITGDTTGNQLNTDPLLDSILRSNGGITQTHALRLNSPAIDNGGSVEGIVNDQRGSTRPFDFPAVPNAPGGDGSDIGAYERQSQDVTHDTFFDFDGDYKSDISIFRPSSGQWWYLRSSDNSNRAFSFGNSADKIVPADFTGDGKTDVAVWRESTGEWLILRSEDSSFYSFPFGSTGDKPAPADFDGDGRADAAVFRPSNSTWYISKSSGGTIIRQFGTSEDIPQPADYDGDGKADLAIFRPSNGQWWINRSTDQGTNVYNFGTSTDKLVPADYTGDGKADVAIWRPSTGEWFILRSEDASFYSFPFGLAGDTPAPGDYDGDGRADAAVFRHSTSTWYLQRSTSGFAAVGFGTSGDRAVPGAYTY